MSKKNRMRECPAAGRPIEAFECAEEFVGVLYVRRRLVVFEEREQRRVKSVFSRIVSPDVVNELLGAEKLSLGGTRR